MEIGQSFYFDCKTVDELVNTAMRQRNSEHTMKERCSDIAKRLDTSYPRSPKANGLLAIAIDQLVEVALRLGLP